MRLIAGMEISHGAFRVTALADCGPPWEPSLRLDADAEILDLAAVSLGVGAGMSFRAYGSVATEWGFRTGARAEIGRRLFSLSVDVGLACLSTTYAAIGASDVVADMFVSWNQVAAGAPISRGCFRPLIEAGIGHISVPVMENGIKHPTLGEKTFEQIKSLILSGKILPGERLLYSRLVRDLGVSQTPIKEAFTRLENEGYVITVQRKGTFARKFSQREIRETFEIREMLEALAARSACAHADADSVGRLRKINARFSECARRRDVKACTREDYAFHVTLIHMSGNEKLRELMKRANYHLQSIAQNSPDFLRISGKYCAMHDRIIRAIEKRDPDTAEKLVREHIRYGMDEVLPAIST